MPFSLFRRQSHPNFNSASRNHYALQAILVLLLSVVGLQTPRLASAETVPYWCRRTNSRARTRTRGTR
ncbi:MAG: hypothetical protein ABI885_30320, partial [Gammaproteobacteria bacterium]